jgi:hypothetical protein
MQTMKMKPISGQPTFPISTQRQRTAERKEAKGDDAVAGANLREDGPTNQRATFRCPLGQFPVQGPVMYHGYVAPNDFRS